MKAQNKRNITTRKFLLSFFSKESGYSEIEINGFQLVKQFNKLKQLWNVAIFTSEAFMKRKRHKKQFANILYKNPRGNSGSEDK